MMTKPLVYLSGPISGVSEQDALGWRVYAARNLDRVGITALSPLRGKSYTAEGWGPPELCAPGTITSRDRADVSRSRAMLVFLLNPAPALIGTAVEYGWADARRIPIITVMEDGSPFDHPFIRQLSTFITPSLDTALVTIAQIILP